MLKFEDYLWSDSRIKKIEIVYDTVTIYLWNEYAQHDMTIKCIHCAGMKDIYLWDETIIDSITINQNVSDPMIDSLKKVYDYYDTCRDKSFNDAFTDVAIKLVNYTEFHILCQQVEIDMYHGGSQGYPLEEYPEVESVEFPKEIHVAYAVCGKACGNREFIVDGETQVCEYCKKSMFRTEVRKYILAEDQE